MLLQRHDINLIYFDFLNSKNISTIEVLKDRDLRQLANDLDKSEKFNKSVQENKRVIKILINSVSDSFF